MLPLLQIQNVPFTDEHKEQIEAFLTHWSQIIKRGTPVDLKKGQILFYEGHMPCGVYIVTKGVVCLVKESPNNEIIKIGTVGLSQPIGLDLLQHNLPYPHTAIVEKEMQGFFVSKASLTDLTKCLCGTHE